MSRFHIALLSAAILMPPVAVTPAHAQTRTVTTQPTVQNMQPGQSVLFDDKKCPAGQIARYTKSQRKEQIGKRCVHINGPLK